MRGKRIGQSFALRREYEKSKKKRLGKKKKRESRKTKNFALSRAFGNTFCEIAHLKSRPAASDTVKTAAKAWERLSLGRFICGIFGSVPLPLRRSARFPRDRHGL